MGTREPTVLVLQTYGEGGKCNQTTYVSEREEFQMCNNAQGRLVLSIITTTPSELSTVVLLGT